MKIYDAPAIRNIALVGHGGCGKTSLTSAMLFDMGSTTRIGAVDDGTTITDFDPDEIERKISLQAALAYGEWKKTKINILDTPGYSNFLPETKAALRVADAAVVVVDSVSGVEVQTEKVWNYASDFGLPRLVVVNRMDRDRASFARTLESLEAAFGRGIQPLALPLGEEKGFRGVVDLLSEQATVWPEDGSGESQSADVPDAMRSDLAAARDKLIEMVAEGNEGLLEEFFDKGSLTPEHFASGLRQAILTGRIFPVIPASATRNQAVSALLDAIVDLLPSPADRPPAEGKDPSNDSPAVRPPSVEAPLSALVFKTIADPHAGRVSLFRVLSGTLKSDTVAQNTTRDAAERFGTLVLLQGKTQTQVTEIHAGDLGAVAKLKETQTGDTIADKAHPIVFPPITFPDGVTTFAIEPKSRGDEDKISSSLHRIMEEDPVLRLSRHPQTHEVLLTGMGQLHIEVVVGKLKKRYKVEVNLKKPKVPYLETIKGAAEGHGRHKKQTGGHGQFADCRIRMRALHRGDDFRFVDNIFGGSIPRNYIPAVEKGIQDARVRGCLAGFPMVDFEVELYDGQYHDVDSSELAFKIAGSLAFKDAIAKCRPTLLEPVMRVEIAVPEDFAGAVMGDLSSRRGRPQGMDAQGSLQVVRAEVPMAEMLAYDADLTSMTGGRGSYHMEFDHYDEVPAHLQEKIIAAAKAERGEVKEEE